MSLLGPRAFARDRLQGPIFQAGKPRLSGGMQCSSLLARALGLEGSQRGGLPPPSRDGKGDTPGGVCPGARAEGPRLQPPRWGSRPGDEVCPIPRPGEAFKCFTCEQPTTISLCKNIAYCKREATACKTTVVQMESGESGPRWAGGPQWSPSPSGPRGWRGQRRSSHRLALGWVQHKGCVSLGAPGPHPTAALHTQAGSWSEEHGRLSRPSH